MLKCDSLLFDLDGTLWDTTLAISTGWNRVVKRNQIPFREVSPEEVKTVVGRPHDECIRMTYKGLSEKQISQISEETIEEDNRQVMELGGHIYPGVKELIPQLAQTFPLFIISNCQTGYIETFFKLSGLESYFKDFECWGHTGLPKANNIQKVIDRNALKAPLYVGDTSGDENASRQCRIPFAFASYGYGKAEKPDLVLKGFQDLLELRSI